MKPNCLLHLRLLNAKVKHRKKGRDTPSFSHNEREVQQQTKCNNATRYSTVHWRGEPHADKLHCQVCHVDSYMMLRCQAGHRLWETKIWKHQGLWEMYLRTDPRLLVHCPDLLDEQSSVDVTTLSKQLQLQIALTRPSVGEACPKSFWRREPMALKSSKYDCNVVIAYGAPRGASP